jgi:hypothetical protein
MKYIHTYILPYPFLISTQHNFLSLFIYLQKNREELVEWLDWVEKLAKRAVFLVGYIV